jgi:hypothetical protein
MAPIQLLGALRVGGAERTEIVIALDWTDFDDDDQTTLVASLVMNHGD